MNDVTGQGGCACGTVGLTTTAAPLLRGICHCTICQSFNQAPFADITVYRARDVQVTGLDGVEFETYRPPPAVQRGKCGACRKPAIEYLKLPGLPKLAIVPSANLAVVADLPEPALHIFYHRRVADATDELPRFSGYLRSQLAFSLRLAGALWRSRNR